MQKIFGNVGRQAKVIAAANIHKIEQHSDASFIIATRAPPCR